MATEYITIGKKEYPVEVLDLNQAELRFYPDNPRVYSILSALDEEPSQEEIEKQMCNFEHIKELRMSIESNGGLIDPLIVRGGDFTVLEGNSRLAAYRILCSKDPVKWGKVKCKVLDVDISEDVVFALLGQYHIIGRKDWEPFEQAHYLYRRHMQTELPIDFMAGELGIGKQKAQKMINVIEFMIKHDDLNKKHWSAYEEYLKNAQINKYRKTDPDIDDTIAEDVKTEHIHEAKDIRMLGDIAKIGDKQSRRVMQKIASKKVDLYEGYSEIQETGKLDDIVKKLKKFKSEINDSNVEKQLLAAEETKQQASYEIGKIIKRLERLQKKIEE